MRSDWYAHAQDAPRFVIRDIRPSSHVLRRDGFLRCPFPHLSSTPASTSRRAAAPGSSCRGTLHLEDRSRPERRILLDAEGLDIEAEVHSGKVHDHDD
jgi:hypothetical protein